MFLELPIRTLKCDGKPGTGNELKPNVQQTTCSAVTDGVNVEGWTSFFFPSVSSVPI